MKHEFTIRVYGILVDEHKGVLVTDEADYERRFTKFPGGGLHWGEGTKDCLHREWNEELGQEIEIVSHLYTTEFFQQSAFNPEKQVICIFYIVKAVSDPKHPVSGKPFDFDKDADHAQSFRWVPWKDFSEDVFTFPIEKAVARLVMNIYKK